MNHPLGGMKILDFTYLLPGPYGTMMLADMGADIIKVENPSNPDLMRFAGTMRSGMSAAYAHVNRGKKSLALDLKKEGARSIVYRLAETYDIIVEQFRPGVMGSFGLGYDDIKKINPSIIYCSLTGYGQTGRYARRAGHDINYMALSGIESFSGRTAAGPCPEGIQIADVCGGSKNLVIAVLAAYIKRLNTGEGDYIDLSITDGTFAIQVMQAADYLSGGSMPSPETEIFNGGSVYDFYRTSDGRYISVGALEPKFAAAFYSALGIDEMAEPALADGAAMSAIKRRVASIIASNTLEHWMGIFSRIDACVEPVRTLEEAASNHPISERDMICDVMSHTGETLRQIANPIKFASGKYTAKSAGVPLGCHTAAILASAGYSDDEINALKSRGVVA